ncbi:MAG: hypothetical protein R3284_12765, partial [Rubricoccaceae bacterium]|nr:hypothetical protein [Rubricoccaceae bacterium]
MRNANLSRRCKPGIICGFVCSLFAQALPAYAQNDSQALALSEVSCTAMEMARTIDPSEIGEPVSAVVIDSHEWVASSGNAPAHCMINGRMEPVDDDSTARPIRFGIALPAEWNGRSIQMGGGG